MNYTEAQKMFTLAEQNYQKSGKYRIDVFRDMLNMVKIPKDFVNIESCLGATIVATTSAIFRIKKSKENTSDNDRETITPDTFEVTMLNEYHEFVSIGSKLSWADACSTVVERITSPGNAFGSAEEESLKNHYEKVGCTPFAEKEVYEYLKENSVNSWYSCKKPFNKMTALYQLKNGLFIRIDHEYYSEECDYYRSETYYTDCSTTATMSVYSPNENDPLICIHQMHQDKDIMKEFESRIGQSLYEISPFGKGPGYTPDRTKFDIRLINMPIIQISRTKSLDDRSCYLLK